MKYILLIALIALTPKPAGAYSVLTHEAIIDVAWQPIIVPILKQRYPQSTPKDLEDAHAYAYGGAIAADMGYYPFGNRLFSDLIHYVRNGDFIIALETEARNVREYAFAMGALAHYNADKYGHALGVNRAVPLLFPKMKEEFGPVVTYEDGPINHVRTEFGFDVLQTARGNYASDAYHRFISFEVADSLLRRAFEKNYDLSIDSIFKNFPRSVRTFRWAVKDIFPQLTKQAWKSKRSEIMGQGQSMTARKFHYSMRRKSFIRDYGRDIEQPKLGARIIAGVLLALPKIGPLKALKPVIPGPEAEKLFIQSFDSSSARYHLALTRFHSGTELANIDFDTGKPSEPGEYKLADKAYYDLLMALKAKHFAQLSSELKNHILSFYARGDVQNSASLDVNQRRQAEEALKELKALKTTTY